MQTSVQPTTVSGASCADASPAGTAPAAAVTPGHAALFPPRDADADTRRRWLASSPWPEVVFASAGAH